MSQYWLISSVFLLMALAADPMAASPRSAAIGFIPRDAIQPSCWHKTHFRSRFARSSTLFSADKRHWAYIEVAAKAFRAPDIPAHLFNEACQNTSKLLVGDAKTKNLRPVFQLGSNSFTAFGEVWASDGNGMRLVDWSPSGRYLLVELSLWKYETEGQRKIPLLYEVGTGKTQMVDLQALLERRFGSKCEVNFKMEGFSPAEQPIVLLSPPEADNKLVPCVNHNQRFGLQFGEKQLDPLPILRKPKRYGNPH